MDEKISVHTPPSEEHDAKNELTPPGKHEADQETQKEGGFKSYIRVFSYADKVSWLLFVVAFLCSIGSGTILPLTALIFGDSVAAFNDHSVGASTPADFQGQVLRFVLWYIYFFIIRFTCTYVATVCVNFAAIRTTKALRQDFLEKTIRQEVWYFDSPGVGSPAIQVTTNVDRIYSGMAEKLTATVASLSTFAAAFIVALAVQWKLALITMTIVPAIFLVTGITLAFDSVYEAKIMKLYSAAGTLAEETFSSVRTVHAFWARTKLVNKYDDFLAAAHKISLKKMPIYGALFSIEYFCVYSGISLAFWQGYRMYNTGEVAGVGQVFTVLFAVMLAATSISTLAPQTIVFSSAAAAAAELFTMIDKPSLLDPLSEDGERPETCRGSIEIRDLRFAYPLRQSVEVLKGLDLDLPAGKTTALVGASGSGKSTLVGLLERWYERKAGSIKLDGVDIKDLNVKWLRTQMGLVQQEPVLFQGTVFENVARGFVGDQPTLPRDEQMKLVEEACVASNAHDFISELPRGYDTQVGERAGMLSGGQRQRVAIARSIISNPRILLLDEATSALDPKAERAVQDALDQVSADRTTLIIAHRLATIQKADSIAVLSNGEVVEQGTHRELLKAEGHYARLVAAQDLGGADNDGGHRETDFEKLRPELSRAETKESRAQVLEDQTDPKENESMGYSLIKCIWIMLLEQKKLFPVMALIMTACLMGAATYPAQAILFSRFFQVFTLKGAEGLEQANFWALMFFILALGNLLAYFIVGVACVVIFSEVLHRYRREMFDDLLKQDMAFFDQPQNTSGALTSKISSFPTSLQELLAGNLWIILIVVGNIVASAILALAYGWKLALVVLFGGLPPLLIAGYSRIRLEVAMGDKVSKTFGESAGLASEGVIAIKTISSLTQERPLLKKFSEMMDGIARKQFRFFLSAIILYSLSQSLDTLIMALGFWYGGRLVANGEYTIGQFYIIFIGILFSGQAAAQFFVFTTSITKARGAANYILWLRSLRPVMQETEASHDKAPKADGDVDLENLDFQYPQGKTRVLSDLSLNIKSGKFSALVGPSGCGKSTMINLLERFYDPTSGSLTFARQPVASFSPRLYRETISLVQQEPLLFQGSVRENIELGLTYEPTKEEVVAACKMANAYDFVSSLPEGLETLCGTRGLQLSGGQKQRIAIARAMIRKPRLLLLDEATSALDTQSERVVQAALDQAAEGRTTIAVAHRLSTIKHADVIFVFGHGRIVEAGTHEKLLGLRGKYFEMCQAQSLDQA